MNIDEAKGLIACALGGGCSQVCNTKYRDLCSDEKVIEAMQLAVKCMDEKENNEWIPVIDREATEEEKECYDFEIIYDCKLPENGQEVLITTNRGDVACTTFYDDYGCYFEDYYEEGEVVAWMPLPLPYVKEKSK